MKRRQHAHGDVRCQPVALAAIKTEPKLRGMALLKFSRLSVQPVTASEWTAIRRMGGLK